MERPKRKDYPNIWDYHVALSDYKSGLFDEFCKSKHLYICLAIILVLQLIPMPLWVRPFVICGIFAMYGCAYIFVKMYTKGD